MSEPSRRRLTLALALTPGIGGRSITRILTRIDLLGHSIKDFLACPAETLPDRYRMPKRAAAFWTDKKGEMLEDAEIMQNRLDPLGVSLMTAADAHYPRQIELFDPDPPGVLFLYGAQRLLESRTFCVLSSRQSSDTALREMEAIVEERVLTGQTVVTGHDTPEYQRAAVVPLRWGAPRVLVLDRGLFKVLGDDLRQEPFRAARLWRHEFDPRTDLVISTINPLRDYHPNSNRIRDRLIASLCQEIDCMEVREGGNMHRLAVQALKAGRPVRVSPRADCYDALLALGAKPLDPKF